MDSQQIEIRAKSRVKKGTGLRESEILSKARHVHVGIGLLEVLQHELAKKLQPLGEIVQAGCASVGQSSRVNPSCQYCVSNRACYSYRTDRRLAFLPSSFYIASSKVLKIWARESLKSRAFTIFDQLAIQIENGQKSASEDPFAIVSSCPVISTSAKLLIGVLAANEDLMATDAALL